MKRCFALLALSFICQRTTGHPETTEDYLDHRQKRQVSTLGLKPGFNAEAQRVDVSGKHAFIPPGPGDQRGPCPGLNAMANHNYIPRNGVATIQQFIEGCFEVFGLGFDVGAILAVYSSIFAGNGLSLSVGGPTNLIVPSALGSPQGLSFSHNKFEGDASPTRGDLFVYGEASRVQVSQFKDLLAMDNGKNPNYNLELINAFYAKRLVQSKAQNPYYFHAPLSGVLLVGAYNFIFRLMANKSAEHPEGFLSRDVLKSFYAITGNGDSLTYLPGHERIPNNWYKRAIGDEYNVPAVQIDLLRSVTKYPQFLQIGGNTGSVNSFLGVDISNLTGGAYSFKSLLQGNNLGCYTYQLLQAAMPDLLKGVIKALTTAVTSVMSSTLNETSLQSCPQLKQFDPSSFSMYPGYTDLLPDGTYTGSSQLVRMLWPGLRRPWR